MANRPTLQETALGTFLHDTGKLLQRAAGSEAEMTPGTRALEGELLPLQPGGRYSHRHALWTEEFFARLSGLGGGLPRGYRFEMVRRVAVYHHSPEKAEASIGAFGWLAAEADRLSSGMERKEKDEEEERVRFQSYRETPLQSPFANVRPDGSEAPKNRLTPLEELRPEADTCPRAALDAKSLPAAYGRLWDRFWAGFQQAAGLENERLFVESLLSLTERTWSAVPSSTRDQPDVSLHDHSRGAAAVAAALYRFHEADGSLESGAAIRDRSRRKFRAVIGDLSGIQASLFLLANQQVKGANRILRARSFLLGMVTEGAMQLCLRTLELPLFSVLQQAGGQFVLLAANTPDVEERIERVRAELDPWLSRRHHGGLAMNLALSEPFSGEELHLTRFPELQRRWREAAQEAKLRPLRAGLQAVHRVAFPHGACAACGVRPAERAAGPDDDGRRCAVCEQEHDLGSGLPRMRAFGWRENPAAPGVHSLAWAGGLRLCWAERECPAADAGWLSLARLEEGGDERLAWRHVSNYVPRLGEGEAGARRYQGLSDEAKKTRANELKQFEHLAADAQEETDGGLGGESLLAVLKADVDRLGQVFGGEMKTMSLSRSAALSRLLDYFFTARLPVLLRSQFPSTYTVYAGGDDLLLVGPWRQTMALAAAVRQEFGRWVGTPHLTLSAGVALCKAHHPLTRTVREADERLARAKEEGRDRVSAVIDRPVTWGEYRGLLQEGEALCEALRSEHLSPGLLYRLLSLDEERQRAEGAETRNGGRLRFDLGAASWRAKWGYQVARNVLRNRQVPEAAREPLARRLNGLLGLDGELHRTGQAPSARLAVTVALYRYRK